MCNVAFSDSGNSDGVIGCSKVTRWMASYLESTRKLPETNQELIELSKTSTSSIPSGDDCCRLDVYQMLQAVIFDPSIDPIVVEMKGNKVILTNTQLYTPTHTHDNICKHF